MQGAHTQRSILSHASQADDTVVTLDPCTLAQHPAPNIQVHTCNVHTCKMQSLSCCLSSCFCSASAHSPAQSPPFRPPRSHPPLLHSSQGNLPRGTLAAREDRLHTKLLRSSGRFAEKPCMNVSLRKSLAAYRAMSYCTASCTAF